MANTSSRPCQLVTWLTCFISLIFVAALTQGRESAWFPVLSAGFPFAQLPKHLLLFRRRLSAPDTGHSNDEYLLRIAMTCVSFPVSHNALAKMMQTGACITDLVAEKQVLVLISAIHCESCLSPSHFYHVWTLHSCNLSGHHSPHHLLVLGIHIGISKAAQQSQANICLRRPWVHQKTLKAMYGVAVELYCVHSACYVVGIGSFLF